MAGWDSPSSLGLEVLADPLDRPLEPLSGRVVAQPQALADLPLGQPVDRRAEHEVGVLAHDVDEQIAQRLDVLVRVEAGRLAELRPDSAEGPLGLALVAARLNRDWPEMTLQLERGRERQPEIQLSLLPLEPGWSAIGQDPAFLEALRPILAHAD